MKLREPDYLDRQYWYKIQSWGTWYAVKACCRSCATRKLQGWTDLSGMVITKEYPNWLIKLDD